LLTYTLSDDDVIQKVRKSTFVQRQNALRMRRSYRTSFFDEKVYNQNTSNVSIFALEND
jgi:hypothetical protein